MTGYPELKGAGDPAVESDEEWIEKPFSVEELARAVKRALERR